MMDIFTRLLTSLLLRYARRTNNMELYVRGLYRRLVGRWPNLSHPSLFTEKIQWLKLHDHNPIYHKMVDKYEAKQYVADKIGREYIIPTLGVWEKFDEIDFSLLPDKFVIKSTNGGGNTGVIICNDKKKFNPHNAKIKLEKSMRNDIYAGMGEWVYKDLKARIIAEQYIEPDPNSGDLPDYKFFCFNGEPKILFYASERHNKEGHPPLFDYYDMDFNKMNLKSRGHKNSDETICYFPQLEKMKELAKVLSENIPFVRVDFYFANERVFFGELTFYHDSGFVPFEPNNWDKTFGDWLVLPIDIK